MYLFNAALLFALGAQQYTPPPPSILEPCKPTKKAPCTPPPATPATAATPQPGFPFPGETAPTPPVDFATPSTQQVFAFPGEPATAPAPNPAASSSSSSPSSSSSSSSTTATPPASSASDIEEAKPATAPPAPTRFTRRRLVKTEDKDLREQNDLEVSRYYLDAGDYRAAYLRAQDAVATVPDDPEAHFFLAESARKLKLTAQAIAEFNTYRTMDPEGLHIKAADKALEEINPTKR